MERFAIYSAGGFAREIKSAFVLGHAKTTDSAFEVIFIDDDPASIGTTINGCRVIGYDEARSMDGLFVNVAFADPQLRRQKYETCERDGLRPFSIFAPTFVRYDDVQIGSAAIFADHTIVTANARIGKAFHCNLFSYVAHDCIVGDFVTLAPRVSLNGRIRVEDGVYVGSDATFLPGRPDRFLTIGEGAVIGAGALVTRDVEPHTTVVGSPAKPLRPKSV